MDRCRCKDYAKAVDELKFYTVGIHRPDIIDNFDKAGYMVYWIQNKVDHTDLRMSKPRALKILKEHENPRNFPPDARRIKSMWCPYMTPYVDKNTGPVPK